MPKLKYQSDFSSLKPIVIDKAYKKIKVDKMLSILAETKILEKTRSIALDIGCSAGFFTQSLSPYFDKVIGIDIDYNALKLAKSDPNEGNLYYAVGDSMNLPFANNSIDLILCNHVYEHVPDAEILFDEIERVLSYEGVCYFGAASRLTIIEPHFHLPFLSWLPKPLAHRYMRLFNKGNEYYENLRTYWGIKRLINNFDIDDYTLEIFKDPDKYKARDLIPKKSLISYVPIYIWRFFYPVLPSYIFILKKSQNS